ncbi:casein kinase ii subunit beta [Anaeramoeba flamelloides]|uniref:Casein kinase II subunit beta n=1 Tax=Anaeramoeba flamelloides TaxID=1746091 RepID=A0ABQ8XXH0_9EUKA|nr:casein kinase ii subunit beta [Anaeramoeba flamelloides]
MNNKNKRLRNTSSQENGMETEQQDSSSSEHITWPEWFCDLDNHEFFCEIEDEYLMDDFNFYGLKKYFKNYPFLLDTIRDIDNEVLENLSTKLKMGIEKEAKVLYGLIHARYILTYRGMKNMIKKYKQHVFGTCQRYLCKNSALLPLGIYDIPKKNSVKLYCPSCCYVYHPPKKYSRVDGSSFGSSFPHFLLCCYPQLKPQRLKQISITPKIFGFSIHKSVKHYYNENQVVVKQNKSNEPNNNNLNKHQK